MYSEFTPVSIANTVRKCLELRAAINPVEYPVQFSFGNTKTGALVPSVSLIPVADCGANCKECARGCYDVRHDITRPSVARSRAINSAIYHADPERYFREISASLYGLRFFRFHIGGDIINAEYLAGVIRCAVENPHCKILVFTKSYELVNSYIDNGGAIPENLRIIFSRWANTVCNNPYNFPESFPRFGGKYATRPGYLENNETIPAGAVLCGGDCSACALSGCGCFDLPKGGAVVFEAH